MTPATAIANMDRQMVAHGQAATLRLSLGTTPPTFTDVSVRVVIRDYDLEQLTGALQQGDRLVILRNTELTAGGHRAPRKGDRLVAAGVTYTLQSVDTRKVADTTVSHWAQARG